MISSILLDHSWSAPQDIKNNSSQDSNNLLKPSYVDIKTELLTNIDEVLPMEDIKYTFTFKNIGTEEPESLLIKFYAPNEMLSGDFHGNFTRLKERNFETSKVVFDSINRLEDGSYLLKTITWHVDKLALDDYQAVQFTLTVDSLKESKTLIGIMTISCIRPKSFYNSNSADVTVILLPDLTISKSVSPSGPYAPGDTGRYMIIYRNNGNRAIDSVFITDEMPSGIIIGNPNPLPDAIINNTYSWYIDSLAAKQSGTIYIPFQVDSNFKVQYPKSVFENFAEIQSGTYYDSARISFNVIAADIIAKIDPLPESYSPGYPIELNATIENIGISPIEKPFNVAFYLNKINSSTQIGDKTVIPFLQEDGKQTKPASAIWENPPEGDHTIIVYADCDTVIPELTEVNNIDSTIARVQISELHVYTNEVLYYDTTIRDKSPKFPDDIFAYTSVLDQNLHPVRKLGNSLGWVSENEMTELNIALTNIWSLSENDQPVDPLSVTEILPDAGFPISTTIVVPISKSDILTAIKNELCNFINGFSITKDQFAVVSFSHHLLNVLPFSNNFENVCNAVTQESNESPTALFDAIYRGVAETAKQSGRRAVIAVTDGNNFSFIQNNEVIDYAKRLSVPVFVLNYGTVNQQILQSLSNHCGGLYFDVSSADALTDVFQQLFDMLNNYYIVSYATPTPSMNGIWRSLDLTIEYPNYLQPVGRNNQGIYLVPANTATIWMDMASFPSRLTENARGHLWKLTDYEESYEYVITFSNNGNRLLENISLENWQSPYVDIVTNIDPSYTVDMGQNHVINHMADIKDELPLQWLSIIDSARIFLDQELMATAYDTVWLIQDLRPEIRVAFTNEPYPQTDEPLRITLADLIMFWVSWPIYLEDFSIKIIPFEQNEIDFTGDITNMPQFPVEPDILAIKPDYKPPKKFTELEEEPWVVRFEYIDQLGQSDFVETMFYLIAPNKLILDKNVSRRGEDVGITVFIAKENQVKIDVFNVAGEHIKNLEDTFYPKNSEATTTGKSLTWDCKDKDGRIVGSDVYVIVMEAGGFKTWKKVIIVH